MLKTLCAIAAVVASLFIVNAQNLAINVPATLTQCQPAFFSWSGGNPPYDLILYQVHNFSSGVYILQKSNQQNFTWIVNVPGGNYGSVVVDSWNVSAESTSFPVLESSNSSCLSQSGTGGLNSSTISTPSSALGAVSSASLTSSLNNNGYSTSTSSSVSNSAPYMSVIIGCVTAVLVTIIVLCGFGFFFFRRWRKQQERGSTTTIPYNNMPTPSLPYATLSGNMSTLPTNEPTAPLAPLRPVGGSPPPYVDSASTRVSGGQFQNVMRLHGKTWMEVNEQTPIRVVTNSGDPELMG